MIHWFVLIQIVLSLLYVAYLIYQYALSSVGWFVKISVYFTWLLCFGSIVLLPYDIDDNSESTNKAMAIAWRVIYGLIFFLTWVLLPIAQEYQTAGQFSIKQKLKRAVINNLIIYGIFAIIGVIALGYLIITGKVDIAKLPPVLMAASNGFGMFLVVIFLSYGLIAIPKNLWRFRKYELKLKEHQFSASNLMRQKQKIMHELELKVKQILWITKQKGETIETVQILNIVPGHLLEKWKKNVPNLGFVNVVKVHKQIKELTLSLSRLESRWQQLSIESFKIEDVLTYMDSQNRRIQSIIFPHYQYQILNYFQWVWNCRLKLWLSRIFSVIFIIFAVAIIIAQVTSFIPEIIFVNPFTHITQIESFLGMDIVLLFLMSYMAFCIYTALFKLKFSSFYGLYWNQQTDAASLIFFSINCSRVSNALCYNFLQVLSHKQTSFLKVMGETNLGPLFGNAYKGIFSILLILLILFNACDIYSRICKRFGINKFQFQAQFDHDNIDEGRRLLQKARTDLQIKILNSNCKSLDEFRNSKSEQIPMTAQSTNKDSSSSDTLQFQNKYFNEYPDMQKVAKILDM